MAITANGFIAKEDDNTDWISKEEWDCYVQMAKKVGNFVIGHRTYDILTKQDGFEELADVQLVVVSNKDFELLSPKHLRVKTPKDALSLLADFEEVLIVGGGILNTSFLKEKLIDEIYLDIEPIIFGKGIPLFSPENINFDLKLIDTKKISDNTLQLHYQVIK